MRTCSQHVPIGAPGQKDMRATRYPPTMPDPAADVERWRTLPTVAQVRPAHCRWCNAASQPVGRPLVLVGHGVRRRQLWGPLQPEGPPCMVEVFVRRFLCRRCQQTVTVGPRQRQRQRLYNASTILLALALWGLCGLGSVALRALLSPWRGATTPSWASLGRWVKAALAGTLWPMEGMPLGQGSLREQVARLVQQWVGQELGEDPRVFAHRAFCVWAGRG